MLLLLWERLCLFAQFPTMRWERSHPLLGLVLVLLFCHISREQSTRNIIYNPPPLRHPRTLLEAISILFVSPEAIFHFLKTLQPPYFLFFQNTSGIATKVISPSQHSNSLLELFRRSDCCPCFRGTPPTSALLSDHITSYFRHHFPTLATSPVRTNFSSHLDPPFLLFHYDITYDAQSLLGWNFLRVKSVSYIYIL